MVKRKRCKTSSSVPPPPWIELPPEITANILQRLSAVEILESAQKVCTTWWKVSKDPAMWRTVDISCPPLEDFLDYGAIWRAINGTSPENEKRRVSKRVKMCQQAVDRSQGQAIAVKVTNLGMVYAELIPYIADFAEPCGELRFLSLDFRTQRPVKLVSDAVKKLPLLEELHLYVIHASSDFCVELVEAAGNSCPMLKSFTMSKKESSRPVDLQFLVDFETMLSGLGCDDVALAVAKWMPGLRHLGLVGNSMTSHWLKAILDGCIHLKLLDLRRCFLIRLYSELGRRCSQQMTDLRLGGAEEDLVGYDQEKEFYSEDEVSFALTCY